MFLDTIHGLIARRVLLNFRIQPDALASVLPSPFRPKLYRGHGIGGVCLIRFQSLRPRGVPAWLGMGSENAAHRIAVEWEQDGQTREGVYIPQRNTNSGFNTALGGRVFPGVFTRGCFHVEESQNAIAVRVVLPDGREEIAVRGEVAANIPQSSLFPTVEEAASFFSLGATGYSTGRSGELEGMELKCFDWTIAPLQVQEARSAFFDQPTRFPAGVVEFDCALLMRNIVHEWHSRPKM